MEDDYFLQNPITINIYDIEDDNFIIKKQLTILSGVPDNIYNHIIKYNAKSDSILKNYYGSNWKHKLNLNSKKLGGNDEIDDFSDIDFEDIITNQIITESNKSSSAALITQPKQTNILTIEGGIIYNNDIAIFPTDSIKTFKFKLAAILNTSIYKIHIPDLLDYEILIDDEIQYINIYELFSEESSKINGIPISRLLYSNASLLHTHAIDHLSLLESATNIKSLDLFLLDIFFKDKSAIEHIITTDFVQRDLLYYSFIYKYYPILTLEMFEDYIIKEKVIFNKYPDLFKSPNIYKKELNIRNKQYKVNESKFTDSFSKLYITVKNLTHINLWNIFDVIDISMFNNLQYLQYSTNIDNNNIVFTKINKYITKSYNTKQLSNNETIYFNFDIINGKKILFTIDAEGNYMIQISVAEGVYDSINNVIKFISDLINPIIDYINTNIRNMKHLLIVNNYTIENIYGNFYIIWDEQITEMTLKSIVSNFENYVEIEYFTQLQNTLSYSIQHGMSFYERTLNVNNEFQYYSDAIVKKKWEFIMNSKIMNLQSRNANLLIEFININLDEFDIIMPIVMNIISSTNVGKLKDTVNLTSSKLKHIDPVLYNFKSVTKTKYTRFCQKPNQPIIISKEKAKGMKNVLEYKNFTNNEKNYYYCPNKKFPFVKFLPNVHPDNLCIPCCKKKLLEEQPNYQHCLNKFKYDANNITNINSDTKRYIINYNLDIEFANRIMHLPSNSLELLFNNKPLETNKYYIFGIQQNTNNIPGYSLLFTIATAWNIKINKFVKYCTDFLADNIFIFNKLLNGELQLYFNNMNDLIMEINNIFILNKTNLSKTEFDDWDKLFIELLTYMNTHILIFEEIDNNIIFKSEYSINSIYHILHLDLDFIVFIKKDDKYNIIIYTSEQTYSNEGEIQYKYKASDNIIIQCIQLINADDSITSKIEINLNTVTHFINEHNEFNINSLFVNRNNLVYAVLLKYQNSDIYIAINESVCINCEINKIYLPYNRNNYNTTLNSILLFINKYNKFVLDISKSANIITKHKINEYAEFIKINNNNDINAVSFEINQIRSMYEFLYIDKFIIIGNIDDCNIVNHNIIGVIINGLYYYFNDNIKVNDSNNTINAEITNFTNNLQNKEIENIICRPIKLGKQNDTNTCKLDKYNEYYIHECVEPFVIQNAYMNLTNDIKQDKYLETLYDINIYKILLFKIIAFYKSKKDKQIRDIIYKHVNNVDNKNVKIDEFNNYDNQLYINLMRKLNINEKLMKEVYDEIYSKLNNIFHSKHTNIQDVKNYFDNNIFKFDGLEIESFKYLTKNEIYEKLLNIAPNIVEINNNKNTLEYSNKLNLCENVKNNYIHCNNNKLLINNKTMLNNLLDLISYDFINPFKRDMITSLLYIDTVIDKYIFTQYINQKIYINIY